MLLTCYNKYSCQRQWIYIKSISAVSERCTIRLASCQRNWPTSRSTCLEGNVLSCLTCKPCRTMKCWFNDTHHTSMVELDLSQVWLLGHKICRSLSTTREEHLKEFLVRTQTSSPVKRIFWNVYILDSYLLYLILESLLLEALVCRGRQFCCWPDHWTFLPQSGKASWEGIVLILISRLFNIQYFIFLLEPGWIGLLLYTWIQAHFPLGLMFKPQGEE